jgi:two-component system, LytTR family, response regulator
MRQLKILIADDEMEARELIAHFLKEVQLNVEVGEASDGKETLVLLDEFGPDILLLDVNMPEMSGLEVLQRKQRSVLPVVIFTTAYDHYALPAFEFEALDYLLKPFDKERFEKALKRAIEQVDRTKKARIYPAHITVKTGSRSDLIQLPEVEYFQAEGSYIQVVTKQKTYLIADTIHELESQLDPQLFMRVHRSVIVNIKEIRSIQSLLNGDHILKLNSGKELRSSRTYRQRVNGLK